MKNILITLIASLFLLGCKKERILYISDDIKKNFSYKPGSYWIYRDSATGREDSCYLSNVRASFQEPRYYSSLNDYDKVELMVVSMRLAKYMDIEFYVNNDFLNGLLGSGSKSLSFGCYLPISQSSYEKNKQYSNYGYFEYLNSLILSGTEHRNIFKVYRDIYESNDNLALYFLNESAGIIKMKTTYDSVAYNWELVRYNIIR